MKKLPWLFNLEVRFSLSNYVILITDTFIEQIEILKGILLDWHKGQVLLYERSARPFNIALWNSPKEREPCLDDSSTSITNHRWFAHGAHRLLTQESGQCTFRPALLAAKYCFCLVSEKRWKPAHPIRKRSHQYVASWPCFRGCCVSSFWLRAEDCNHA